jgi:glycosyltransferase involved in cell wall biosynthesis
MSEAPLDVGVFGARTIPSTYSGYETFLTTLLPRLAARGHRVTMYCRSTETLGDDEFEGVHRVRLPAIAGKYFNTPSHGLVASLRCRLARHDVVLVVNVANALYCALNKYTGQRILLNTDGQEWLRGKWGPVARWFFRLCARTARFGATGLISDSAAMATIYEQEFASPSSVIPYCFPSVAPVLPTSAPERIGVRRGAYFLIAARLNPENNVDVIAEQYCRSAFRQPLVVLGTANYRSPVATRLARLAARDERVRLVGHVADRSEFLDLVGSATAYLHGHSVGGMNPSLLEAMCAGALVVALDTPFNRETLADAGLFFALDPSRGPTLREVLGGLGDEGPQSLRRLRAAAEARAAACYDVDTVVNAYERLLRASLTVAPRGPIVLPTHWR